MHVYRGCLRRRKQKKKTAYGKEKEMTEKEKMLSGQLYDPSDPELCRLRVKARKLARR